MKKGLWKKRKTMNPSHDLQGLKKKAKEQGIELEMTNEIYLRKKEVV